MEEVYQAIAILEQPGGNSLALSTMFWTALYLVVICLPLISDKSFDFKNRVVSIVHAVASAILALWLVALRKPLEIGGPNTPKQVGDWLSYSQAMRALTLSKAWLARRDSETIEQGFSIMFSGLACRYSQSHECCNYEQILVLNVSSGYFIYDYAACTLHDAISRRWVSSGRLIVAEHSRYGRVSTADSILDVDRFDMMNFFHHFATLMGLVCGLVTGRSGAELGLCLVLMEVGTWRVGHSPLNSKGRECCTDYHAIPFLQVSNPFMHMIQIYKHLGMSESGIAIVNKVGMTSRGAHGAGMV